MKVALGTVQFGLDYGISNPDGKTPTRKVNEILQFAYSNGIQCLDTASAYGSSEEVIGRYLNTHRDEKWKTVSKLPQLRGDENVGSVRDNYFERSKSRLGKSLDTYLAHDAEQFLSNPAIRNSFYSLKDRGLIKRIGVSVYSAEQIKVVLDIGKVDVIQLPLNILDHRLIKHAVLKKIKEHQIEIHARSVFLQGLLFLSEKEIKNVFPDVLETVGVLKKIAKTYKLQLRDLALLFVKSIPEVDLMIIGVNSLDQLRKNMESLKKNYDYAVTKEILTRINYDNNMVLNPGLWKS